MNQSPILICIFSALTIFIFITILFHSFALSQVARKPASTQEEKIAKLLQTQIFENNLDEFIETLANNPQYIDVAYYNSKYEDYITPLQLAAILGRDLFIDELLKRGADPFLKTPIKGNTILHFVRITRIIQRFIDLNLDPETPNNQGMTPLLAHVYQSNPPRATIHTLLEAHANPNAQTEGSRLAALHILFKPHHSQSDQEDLMSILRDLLNHGAYLIIRNKDGATPLHFAARNNNVQGIRNLIKKANQIGAKSYINTKDFQHKNTPLADAYFYKAREAVTELLRLKANPSIRGKYGISVNGRAHKESKEGSSFAQFVLGEIDKYLPPNTCTPALTRNENPSYVSN